MVILSVVATVLFLASTLFFSVLSAIAAVVDRSGKFYLWVGRTWSQSGLLFYGIRLKVIGTEHIRKGRNYVYAANHASYMDIPVLLAGIPDNLRLTLRSSLTRIPIWGWALLIGPFLVLDRSNPKKAANTVRIAVERIKAGASVLFFPEGTRTPNGTMQAFKRGAFHLAVDAGAPVIPVAITGTYQILPRHKWLPRWGGHVTMRIGEAIEIRPIPAEQSRAEEIRVMMETEEWVRGMLS